MILGFKNQFKEKILNGSKIHTIRPDPKRRWKVGNKIHFATGARSKEYDCFKKGECVRVSDIVLDLEHKYLTLTTAVNKYQEDDSYISSKHSVIVDPLILHLFAKNDGFENAQEMFDWFKKEYNQYIFTGKLIFWEDTELY